jgi:AraC-like DNA-binding protein
LPLALKLPTERRARSVADKLLSQPACIMDQQQPAHEAGLSIRSINCLFSQQTGLSFSHWHQQAKVVASLRWVSEGLPVSEIASLSGYSNVSAYIDVFRQSFGKTPSRFN